jgi:cytidyltransferase-like protein
MNYKIVSIDKLLPLELVFPGHLKNLEEMIDNDGFILKAIIADKKTGTILDGSHRYVYFLKKGYKELPVHYIDYDNEDVRVGTHLCHRFFIDGATDISKRECVERAFSGNLFSPRTTRHFFTFRKRDISLSLEQLAKGNPVNVDHLVAKVDISDEIAHNENFIREIDEEIKLIIQYLSEVNETKKYLANQVKCMRVDSPIAFFPGKFHPPHLGHLKTLLDLSKKYNKLIIGVSEHTPDSAVTNVDNIVSMLKSLFEYHSAIEVVRIKGVLVEKTNTEGLPKFDILLSGNPDVLSWAKGLGVLNQFISRADGNLFSGTEIREVLGENDNI